MKKISDGNSHTAPSEGLGGLLSEAPLGLSQPNEKMTCHPQVQGSKARRTLPVCVSRGRCESPSPMPSKIYSRERQTQPAAPGVQECNVLATGERPSLLETHFFSNVWFPFTLFSVLFFPRVHCPGPSKRILS